MADGASRVEARPRVVVLDGINVTSRDHLLPEWPCAIRSVHPDVCTRKGLPDVCNHRSAVALPSVTLLADNHVVYLNGVTPWDDDASREGYPADVNPPAWLGAMLSETGNTIDGLSSFEEPFRCLPSSRSVCLSRACSLFYFAHFSVSFVMLEGVPGVEPGSKGPQPNMLSVTPHAL